MPTPTRRAAMKSSRKTEPFSTGTRPPLSAPTERTTGESGPSGTSPKRKRAEEKLLTSRLQLAEAADLARIAYWEHDGATDDSPLTTRSMRLDGTTAEREGGYRMSRTEYRRRFVHPDDLEDLKRQVDESRLRPRADHLGQYEHRSIRRDGEVIDILNRSRIVMVRKGSPLKVVGVNQDITARKKMENTLREYEKAVENSPDMVAVVDRRYRYLIANSAFLRYRGPTETGLSAGRPLMCSVRIYSSRRSRRISTGAFGASPSDSK